MNFKYPLLGAGILLVAFGVLKPDLAHINRPVAVDCDSVELERPSSEVLRSKANDVIKALSVNSDRKIDGKKLARLYYDMAMLISLDGENQVIKNTEEIRQANKIAGLMLNLDIKGKYRDLPEAAQALVLQAIGDDQVLLNNDLRAKAVEGFKALAWACNEGSK